MKRIFILITLITFSLSSFSQKKNILFITVDDLKPLIGAYGDEFAITPNIDRIASDGFVLATIRCHTISAGHKT